MRSRAASALAALWLWGCAGSDERVKIVGNEQFEARFQAVKAIIARVRAEGRRVVDTPPPQLAADLEDLARKAGAEEDPQIRAACLGALGESGYWSDREVFRRALADPARRCRWEAVHALRLKQDPRAVPEVIELLKRSEELEIRLEAISLLSELHAREAIPVLVAIVVDLLDRNRAGQAACTALRRLTGQTFSAEDYLSWRNWYRTYAEGAGANSQPSASGVGSVPAEGNGAGGAGPPANR
ncbi:MAG TPA: HEAT repeat domain-containing protein [Planctomycetota bacterium]|jgi:hypothetical protein|nr:HEAT repeat domain-containing protein [Planctomycetota bacterium]OQC22169.1 MAG: hypothetical protein BWX69_00020 [Planctomycetes bacterium ADurb.Bin069]HNR99733.1 HEAT repeat domain-containing protein [Planctomycetota bacterium]HNU25352.1 HEAT repeat domain-containing protein [Planctomycetota bacterium]HOE29379.1 HEAT repeat domain-containing protein [Planctomycetota bacterium]